MLQEVIDNGNVVKYQGKSYKQVKLGTFLKPGQQNNNACFMCSAESNNEMCDAICPYCKMNHVFRPMVSKKAE